VGGVGAADRQDVDEVERVVRLVGDGRPGKRGNDRDEERQHGSASSSDSLK